MKTKIQIIQSLLDERKITAEEAMILMAKEVEYVYYPIHNYPVIPYYPTYQIPGTCDTTNSLIISSN